MLTQRIQNLEPSPTLTLDAIVKRLQASGKSVVNFTVGEPDFPTPDRINQAAIAAINDHFTHYTPSAGILELREAIAQLLQRDFGLQYDAAREVIVGVGTKQLLYAAFQTLCQKGDEVIVPTPTWSTYVEQIQLAEATPVMVHLHAPFKLTANDVKRVITPKTKVLLLNSPSNPTGAVIDRAEMEKIGALAVEHDFYLISDEIYEKILYKAEHVSVASLSTDIKARTVTINGFSKAYAMTGWRVGYAAGPADLIAGMVAFSGQTTSGTSSISQKAAVAACAGNEESVAEMVRQFTERGQVLYDALSNLPGVSVHQPEGAFYVFPDISKLLGTQYKTSAEWAAGLLEKAGVAVVPGEAFLAPGFVRFSFATSMENVREGIKRLRAFVEKTTS